MDYLEQLLGLEIDGQKIGDLLDLACADSVDSIRILSRHGIAYDCQTLTLQVDSPALGKLLLSALLREPGASLDVDSQLLSLPLEWGNGWLVPEID